MGPRCIVLVVLLFAPVFAFAQRPPVHGVINNSVMELDGPWAFHPGDNMAWAQPDFDDSAWAAMDLTPPKGSVDPTTGTSGFVSGWTAKGYPKLTGYAWYRLRVDVESGSGGAIPPLAIRMPEDVDDAYQVYVNGQFIGEFGHFNPNGVTFINAQPRAFALPANLRNGAITIAIRMWMDTATPFESPDAGGLHGPPVLGQAEAIGGMLNLAWDDVGRAEARNMVRIPILGLAALFGFILFWLDRREQVYFLLALVCLASALNTLVILTGYYVTWLSMVLENYFTDIILSPLILGLWTVFWAYWFGLPELRRICRATWSLVVLLIVGIALLRAPLYGGMVPVSASAWLQPVTEILKLAFGAVILWIVYRGIRTRGVQGWRALVPIVLLPGSLYQEELSTLHLYWPFNILGFSIGSNFIAMVLMLLAIALLLMRRFVGGVCDKKRVEMEMEQARQMRQILIPETLPVIPGFAIGNEYRPTQQMGGDFFQILPLDNGGVIAMVGDVSGKGMSAAMTVSLLVGTARALAGYVTQSPGELLAAMNQRMIGRSQSGFTTCLVLRADPDGRVTVANAGHLSPYLEGRESQVATGLPLGVDANASYSETTLYMKPGEQLTLVTDGVVEARSQTGELFGFERTASLSAMRAGQIAEIAQRFGQTDDITVLTLVRVAA